MSRRAPQGDGHRKPEDDQVPVGAGRGYTRKLTIAMLALVVLVVLWGLLQLLLR